MVFVAHFESCTQLLFFVYRSPSANSDVFDVISDKIDSLQIKYPSAEIAVFGDFNVHNTEWLVHSRTTDHNGQAAQAFAMSQNLHQLVNCPTRVPDRLSDKGYLLDLFLTSNPDNYHHTVSSPLGSSDHCVVLVSSRTHFFKPSAPFHRTVYRFSKADWCGLRTFLSQVPWNYVLSSYVDTAASDITEWIKIGMKVYIPSRSFQQAPHSQPWFTAECATAICQRNFYFHKNQRQDYRNLVLFKAAFRRCKRTFDLARDRYAKQTRESISSQKLGSKDFWRICNSVLRRNKSCLPSLKLTSDTLAVSSADKAELLSQEFAKNSTLNDGNQSLPSFHYRETGS